LTGQTNKPPHHLGRKGKALWRSISSRYELEAHELELLDRAAEQADIEDQAAQVLKKEGLTLTNARSGNVKPRPELGIQRQATRLLASLLRQLALPADSGTHTRSGNGHYPKPTKGRKETRREI